MSELLRNFWSDESGQGLVEYVLIIALVSIGLTIVMLLFRNSIGNVFKTVSNTLNSAPANPFS
jgi:pilus assembly protein Flp/PilA